MSYFLALQNYFFLCSDIPSEEKKKLDKFLEILEESGVGKIIEKAYNTTTKKGRPGYNPYRLFACIIYGFSKHSGSVRKIEESIRFDTRFLYLMGQEQPSFSTITRFCNNVVVAFQREIFACLTKTILSKFQIDISDTFVDGTKLEANANKYKFVWKPKNKHLRLNEGLRTILSKYFTLAPSKVSFISKEIAQFLTNLKARIESSGVSLVQGKGHRQEQITKDYFSLSKMLLKTLEYEEQEYLCGPNRNSYYKTDKDATAMCLKEDYYSGLGSNMHAAYSLQLLVSKGLILDYYVSQERSDFAAFIPLLDVFKKDYGFYPKRLCADSGYGSLINYRYLKEKQIENYVKHPMWEKMISGQYLELFHFDEEKNLYCLDGRKATVVSGSRHSRGKETKFYLIENCRRCKFKPYCMKNTKEKNAQSRTFEVCYDLHQFRLEANQNLLSTKGIEMRVNRSSQVEGAFGVIKQNMEYDRIRRRGLDNVSSEIMLVCLGYNIRKLFRLIEGKEKMEYWKIPDDLQPEIPKQITMKKLLSKDKKGVNEQLRLANRKRGVAKK